MSRNHSRSRFHLLWFVFKMDTSLFQVIKHRGVVYQFAHYGDGLFCNFVSRKVYGIANPKAHSQMLRSSNGDIRFVMQS